MTATSPAMTGPGFEKLFPAVRDWARPAAVRSVYRSQEGANAIAVPSAASTATASVSTGPRWRTSSWRGASADRSRKASTEPAVQASQPASPSTSPGPSR